MSTCKEKEEEYKNNSTRSVQQQFDSESIRGTAYLDTLGSTSIRIRNSVGDVRPSFERRSEKETESATTTRLEENRDDEIEELTENSGDKNTEESQLEKF